MASSADCGMLMRQIVNSIAKQANNQLRANGLTLSQIEYLDYLAGRPHEKVPLKEIEAHFNVAQSTVAGVLARMVKKDLVVMDQSPWDARAKTASLTGKGLALYLEVSQCRDETEARLLAPLTEAERQSFRELLKKVNDGLKNV